MSQWTLKKDKLPGIIALAILALAAGLLFYPKYLDRESGELQFKAANQRLQDGQYEEAIRELNESLSRDPDHVGAHLTMAITLMQMERFDEAREWFVKTIGLDPEHAAAYANRGIMNDRLGKYEEALEDYKKALTLDPDISKGPGLLTRFLKNIQEKPPTLYDRAVYIQEQLKLPPEKRLLKVPEMDEKQEMYKYKAKPKE
jgi:tetratricopeptide (TPR) repeat protein